MSHMARVRQPRRLQVDDVAGCFVARRDEAETKALVKTNARAVLHVDDRPNGVGFGKSIRGVRTSPSPPLPERHPLNKIAALIDPIPAPC